MKENPDDFLADLPEDEKYAYEQMLVDSAFENSYKVLTKKTTFDKLMDAKDKFGIKAIMIYDPSEEPDEDVWDDVIYYYEDLEEYERCAELLKLKNKKFENV